MERLFDAHFVIELQSGPNFERDVKNEVRR
jgi:hypothetical protein